MKELPSTLTSKYKGSTLTSDRGRVRLLTPIMRNLEKMLAAYEKEHPNLPLKINSAYRTYQDQVRVRNEWAILGKPKNAAYPGTSNHGFGKAVDFADGNRARLTPSMQQYKWIKANAGNYEFNRLAYAGQEDGESWEAWHWQNLKTFQTVEFKSTEDA